MGLFGRRRPTTICCPFCFNYVEVKEGVRIRCVRRETLGGKGIKVDYIHLTPEEDKDKEGVELHTDYIAAALEGHSLRVALIGPSSAGKSVWLESLGSSTIYPGRGRNMACGTLDMRYVSTLASINDRTMESVEEFGLGKLPPRTDPKERGMSLVLLLAPWNDRNVQNVRAVVVKDVAGELARVRDLDEILDDRDKQHLSSADWYFLVLDARSRQKLSESWDLGEPFLNLLQHDGRSRDSRHCVLIYSCLDECSRGSDETVLNAVLRKPNRLDGKPVDLGAYFEGMRTVNDAICDHLDKVLPGAIPRLTKVFQTIHYVGISSLGMTPAIPKKSVDVESQCVCEPLLIRVHDPIFWILHDDAQFWKAALNGQRNGGR